MKAMYWFIPLLAAALVVAVITQLTLVPWYLSAWLAIGLGMMALIIIRRLRVSMQSAAEPVPTSPRPIRLIRATPPATTGAAPPAR